MAFSKSNHRIAKSRRGISAAALCQQSRRGISVLGRPGSDLLFQVLRLSTIGAGEFNGRVRDGIGFRPPAIATRPAKDRNQASGISHQVDDRSRRLDKLVVLLVAARDRASVT